MSPSSDFARSRWQKQGGRNPLVVGPLLVSFLSLSQPASSQQAHSVTEPGARITVRVCDCAPIPRQLLDRAETEATRIFRQAGIEAPS